MITQKHIYLLIILFTLFCALFCLLTCSQTMSQTTYHYQNCNSSFYITENTLNFDQKLVNSVTRYTTFGT